VRLLALVAPFVAAPTGAAVEVVGFSEAWMVGWRGPEAIAF
jgi:hypothetical protein